MDCRNCGRELPQNSSLCVACGARWLPPLDDKPKKAPKKKGPPKA